MSKLANSESRIVRCVFSLAISMVFLCSTVQAASAQAAVTVRGMVQDAGSGAPVAGALLALDGQQVLTSTDGTFRFFAIPTGTHALSVEALGYHPLEQAVIVSIGMDGVELRLEPNPIELQELTVSGSGRGPVHGVVLNARTGAPIPWTDLVLTRGVGQRIGRQEASTEEGVFSIDNVAPGEYLLRVDRIGFESVYVPVSHALPAAPTEVRLEPDEDVLRGVAVMSGELNVRRAGHGRAARVFLEEELRRSGASGMRHFVEAFSSLSLVQCERRPRFRYEEREELEARSMRRNCVIYRGENTRPRLFIDEVEVFDPAPREEMRSPLGNPGASTGDSLGPPPPPPPPDPISFDVLNSYDPRDFYLFEYFECADGRIEMHAYTYQYMERVARRPHVPVPLCTP